MSWRRVRSTGIIGIQILTFTILTAIADVDEETKTSSKICEKRLLTDISIVEIYFGSPFVKKYKRDLQTTLTGKISNIGL